MSKFHKEILTCTCCLNQQPFTIWDSVNVSVDPELKQALINGELTEFVCQKCGNKTHVEYDCLYHDMEKSLAIWLKYPEDDGSFSVEHFLKFPFGKKYIYRVVNSFHDLIDKILIFDDGFSDYNIELMKLLICIRENIDISGQFYYAGTKFTREKEKLLIFALETEKGFIERHYKMKDCLGLVETLMPKISSILDSMSDEWLKVDRVLMLRILEESGLAQKKMETSKSIKYVRVHILDPLGGADISGIDDLDDLFQIFEDHQYPYRVEYWVIGRDLTNEQAEKWKDPTTGDIYVIIHYQNGKPKTHVVSKSIWEQLKANLEKI